MAGEGVRMTYHHHMGTVVENQREVDLLMAHTGSAVGLLLDTGHLVYAGADILETTRRHARRINHVHCKDIRQDVLRQARQQDQSFLRAILAGVFTVPGDGMIDYYGFARLLAEIGYEGWVVVEAEQDPVKAPPGAYSAMGYRHLCETFRAAGFEIVE
jgi:inosose dehydratase